MKHLKDFVQAYNKKYRKKEEVYADTIEGLIKRIKAQLLDENFYPSKSLENLFDKLLRRANYPMEVAITGQFSSGKSTFLNALLSKDILPTGITPVTSKVNFINYGSEYKLKVTYKNGAQAYHNIESISSFTDQREDELCDIKYLSIYAPMEILKDISFVDTPGLNSQSFSDTQTTQNVLRDVDGIIWLSLIDNAGKESEAQILKEYMQQFKNKSLCVLNQKDKFSQVDINKTQKYVKEKFSEYFQEVIPISGKQALEARSQQKEILLEDAMHLLAQDFKNDLNEFKGDLSFFEDKFTDYRSEVAKIMDKDRSKDIQDLHESNIQQVLDFIDDVIRPAASNSKKYAIQKDLASICDILILQYQTIFGVYESLSQVMISKENEVLLGFDTIIKTKQDNLSQIYEKLDAILLEVSHEVFIHIKRKTEHRYEEVTEGLLRSKKIHKYDYENFWIDNDSLYKKLFYDEEYIDKKFKKIEKQLKYGEDDIGDAFKKVYAILESAVHTWQEPYELISKQRDIASDIEFSNTRNFASKVYENVLIHYHSAIEGNISAFKKKFAYLNGVLTLSYKQLINASILHFETSFYKQALAYEKDPNNISLNMPYEEDIYARLKVDFSFSKIEVYLNSRRNYLYKIVHIAKEEYLHINEEKISYIEGKKELYKDKIKRIKEIKNSI
ncbi:dynamin family protein [Sulfurimonas sp. MAG313]|nr:dynamin family protein [Sulfurimonas sp. MAG313]MDF1880947.1 dynamin family protein [Sulfurimonas sp. MAG313]